jgi:hypothetical protein
MNTHEQNLLFQHMWYNCRNGEQKNFVEACRPGHPLSNRKQWRNLSSLLGFMPLDEKSVRFIVDKAHEEMCIDYGISSNREQKTELQNHVVMMGNLQTSLRDMKGERMSHVDLTMAANHLDHAIMSVQRAIKKIED